MTMLLFREEGTNYEGKGTIYTQAGFALSANVVA